MLLQVGDIQPGALHPEAPSAFHPNVLNTVHSPSTRKADPCTVVRHKTDNSAWLEALMEPPEAR